jgi:DNA end-binding protein Ku
MEDTGKAGIGRLVMRGHEYLVAIVAEGGVLRAETLRYFDELRTPEDVGLPAPGKAPKKLVRQFADAIAQLVEDRLDLHELEDREAEALQELALMKQAGGQDLVTLGAAEEDEPEEEGGAQIVDLVQLLRRSLGSPAAAPAKRAARKRPSAR